jgi:hypothetical protein
MSKCQFRGYNPLNNGNKIFGKKYTIFKVFIIMKIIITERQQMLLEMSPHIRRRLGRGENYIMNLNPSDVCEGWDLDDYVHQVITRATLEVVSRTGDWWEDDDYGPEYEEVHDYLSNKYIKDIIQFFNMVKCD